MPKQLLDRRISIYVKTLKQQANGEEVVNADAKLGGVDWWAGYKVAGGGESIDENMMLKNHDVEFTVRYNDLTKTINEGDHYIIYDSRVYGIELVEFVDRQQFIKISAIYKDPNIES